MTLVICHGPCVVFLNGLCQYCMSLSAFLLIFFILWYAHFLFFGIFSV